jgi:7-cyano-7-deazaguanine synthase
MTNSKKAVVLLSGGIDSATTLALAVEEGFESYALSFDYGQRHAIELEAAKALAGELGANRHLVIHLELDKFGGSALTDDIVIPKGRSEDEIGVGIPLTYVPARNTIFLSFALAWAEVIVAAEIFIGATARDYSGYPDCRPEYIEAFQRMADLATRCGVEGEGVRIRAPLIEFSKSEIIKLGRDLGVDFSLTHSCYETTDEGLACGQCDSCVIRKRGFAGAGIEDPTRYVTQAG